MGTAVINLRLIALFPALIFLAGILAPNHYFPWPAFYNELPAGIALLPLAVGCLFMDREGPLDLPDNAGLLMLLPLIPLVQWLSGLIHFAGDAWVSSMYLSGGVIAYFVGYFLSGSTRCGSRELVRWLAWVLMIGALASSAIALRQAFGLSGALWEMEIQQGGRPYANLAQPNQLATLLVLGILSGTFLFSRKEFGQWGFWAVVLFLGMGLGATQSRAALLSVAGLGMWCLWRFPLHETGGRALRKTLMLALGSVAAIWLVWPAIYDLWLVGGVEFRGAGDRARLLIWQQMLHALWLSPVFGYGWGQAGIAQMAVVQSFPNAVPVDSSHNLIIDLLIWNGLVLGSVLVLAAGIWVVRHVRHAQSELSWFLLAMIGSVLLHSMVEYPLYYAYFLLPVCMLGGVLDDMTTARRRRLPKVAFMALLSFGALLFLGVAGEYPKAEAELRQLRFEALGLEHRKEVLERPHRSMAVLTQIDGFIGFARSRAVAGMRADKIEQMRIVSRRYPFPPSLFRYVIALALNDRIDEAGLEMQRLRNLHGEKHYMEARQQLFVLSARYPQVLAMPILQQ
jgi:O-antigen ligase